MVSNPRPPLRLTRLVRGNASGQPKIRAETPTRANRVPFARVTDSTTVDWQTRPVHRRHSRRYPPIYARVPVARRSSSAKEVLPVENLWVPTPSANVGHGSVPAVGTSESSVPPPSQVHFLTKAVSAHNAAPLSNGPVSAIRTHASSAVPPCSGSILKIRARCPLQSWHTSVRLARCPRARAAQQKGGRDKASFAYASGFISTSSLPQRGGWFGVREKIASATAPQTNSEIIHERFMAALHNEGCSLIHVSVYFLVCKALSSNDVGVARGTELHEVPPGTGFKTVVFR